MGYTWNPVKGGIERLKSLFYSLSETFKEQKIDDELLNKWEMLLKALAEMVDNSEKRDKDEEKQHKRSVLEVKKHERIVLELWLEELEDAVFNTEDLVDKIHTEALRHKLDEQICEKMEDIRCSLESYAKAGDLLGLAGPTLYKFYRLPKMRYPMQSYQPMEINTQNDPKEKQRQRGPIEQPLESQRQPRVLPNLIHSGDMPEVFGMDCDKEEIIKLLLSDDANDKQLSVISIVGNARIGKTTLARLVYEEQRVHHHFDRKAWVNVPDDFNRVTQSIWEFLTCQCADIKEKHGRFLIADKIKQRE